MIGKALLFVKDAKVTSQGWIGYFFGTRCRDVNGMKRFSPTRSYYDTINDHNNFKTHVHIDASELHSYYRLQT